MCAAVLHVMSVARYFFSTLRYKGMCFYGAAPQPPTYPLPTVAHAVSHGTESWFRPTAYRFKACRASITPIQLICAISPRPASSHQTNRLAAMVKLKEIKELVLATSNSPAVVLPTERRNPCRLGKKTSLTEKNTQSEGCKNTKTKKDEPDAYTL